MKTKSGLWIVLFVLTAAIAAVFYAQNTQLHREQEALRAELQARDQTALANQRQIHTIDEEPLAPGEKMELMRLRNEVTQLRASATAARDALKSALRNQAASEDRLAQHVNTFDQPVQLAEPAPQNNDEGAHDPLAFYRKNPELMKRYFPHLFRGEIAQQEQQPDQPIQVESGVSDAAEPVPQARFPQPTTPTPLPPDQPE